MINKIKNMIGKIIILVLMLIMVMPTGVFAGTHTVNNWDEYRVKLKEDIMKQEKEIIINFKESEIFNTEYSARLKIASEYEKAKEEMPKHFGELNIKSGTETTVPVLKGTSLESVTHRIGYKTSKEDFDNMRAKLGIEYEIIKTKVTDYEKIKTAYDYVVSALSTVVDKEIPEIKKSLEEQSENAYAVLFAMMMTDMGYNNDVATGTVVGNNGIKWNLVKVQGKWYHVDGKSETIESNGSVNDNSFLIPKNITTWDRIKHEGIKNDELAMVKYEGNLPTLPQLKYEIELIEAEITKTLDEITNISTAEISIEQIIETKKKLEAIEKKVNGYEERKDILKAEADKIIGKPLEDAFVKLEDSIDKISTDIEEYKVKIRELETAIEAVDNAEKNLIENKGILEIGIENAANEALTDISDESQVYKELKLRLEKVINVNEAKKKLDNAENKLQKYVAVDTGVDYAHNEATAAKSLLDAIIDTKYSIIKKELESIIIEIDKVKSAKDKVVEAETGTTKEKNDIAKKAINLVNIKYISIKENLSDRIIKLEGDLINADENKAIEAVDTAEKSIATIPDGSLADIIATAEANVKTAETEVKKIKDIGVRTAQQNRIKEIKLVITAIKAVDKAETVIPLSATNAKSARTAINKIVKLEYDDIKIKLNSRIDIIDDSIKVVDAEKLIEKVEKSLSRADYEKAKAAVEKLKKAGTDKQSEIYVKLVSKLIDCNDMILAKEAVENAEKLMKANKEKVVIYIDAVTKAKENYDKITDKYVELRVDLDNRIRCMETTIKALKEVDTVEVIYEGYLNGSNTESKLRELIKRAEPLVSDINTNFGSIKKSLESRLKVFSDRLNADVEYNKVSKLLSDIETVLIKDGKELGKSTEELERQILGIMELSKNVKIPSHSKDLNDRTTAINDVIAATKAVIKVEGKDEITVVKDIVAANKAVDKLSITGIHKKIEDINVYKINLKERIRKLEEEVETSTNESKATILVDKAISSKKETDIKLAIEAVNKLVDGPTKTGLNAKVEGIVKQLISNAETAILKVITSIERNEKSLSTNVSEAKKAVILAENVVLLADAKLQTIDNVSYKTRYNTDIIDLNNSIKVIDLSVVALNTVQQAEKTKKQEDVDIAKLAIGRVSDDVKYTNMKSELNRRIKIIDDYLIGETGKEETAENLVKVAEVKMLVAVGLNPSSEELRNAQDAVNKVSDNAKKADLQKRIDAINLAIAAKSAVERAEAYTDTTSVKTAEKDLINLVKTGSYFEIVKDLSNRIAALNNQLNISKLVTEATNLVQKAVESRIEADSIKARFAVEGIKELAKDSYDRLIKILDELDTSIKNEAIDEVGALKAANVALTETFKIVGETNTFIAKIVEGNDEATNIKEAYTMIESAKNQVIIANAAVRKLSNQKELLKEIDYANKEIELAEDNIDVKEAVRLVTIASSSVSNAKEENQKSKAKLDIAAARRAIDKIGHNDNKAIKVTILNTINSIEKKLTSDNDQELIDAAVDAVNTAAEILASAVKENKVIEKQEEIDKAIFAAKLAIGWISDNNKAAKATLTGFINDIAAMFEAEKEGIANEDRIKNAEKAVILAESKKGTNELEGFIRSARLRVKMIKNDGAESEAKIIDLNTRLDVLEGKTDGSSGTSGGSKPDGNSGSNKPGGSGTTTGNKVPTTPLPNSDRFIGTTKPIWGKTNELNKKNPVISLSAEEIKAFRIYESKLKIGELSTILKIMQGVNAKLVVRGKNINLDSKPYVHDKVNNSILMPIKLLADELGFSVKLDNDSITNGAKTLFIDGIVDGKTKSVKMDFGKEYCYVNGKFVKISSKLVIHQGRTYIPVDLMVEHFGLTFSFYNEGKNIQLIIN